MTNSTASPQRVLRTRQLLAVGATLSVSGIAMSLGETSALAGFVTVVGVALTVAGVHHVGRLGTDGRAS